MGSIDIGAHLVKKWEYSTYKKAWLNMWKFRIPPANFLQKSIQYAGGVSSLNEHDGAQAWFLLRNIASILITIFVQLLVVSIIVFQ